jgi:SAM-dependent methyltransferase
MKIRDSGMPDQPLWEGFFDAARVLELLDFGSADKDVADLGCGYGTFALAAAKLTRGKVLAFDIEMSMVQATRQRALQMGLANLVAIERDFVAAGTGLAESSVDTVFLFNVLHAEDALGLLREAKRIVKTTGNVRIIHWVHGATPRGPGLDIRPRPEQCVAWASAVGLSPRSPLDLPPYHFGVIADNT